MSLLGSTVRGLSSTDLVESLWKSSHKIIDDRTLIRSTPKNDQSKPENRNFSYPSGQELNIGLSNYLEANAFELSSGDQRAVSKQIIASAEKAAGIIRIERIRQAQRSFNLALLLAVLGVLLILCGAALTLTHTATAGVMTTIASAIPEAIAALLFRLNNQANDRLDKVNNDLARLSRFRLAMDLIDSISDPRSRDRAIVSALRALNHDESASSREGED
jgi:hypothetical protein